MKVHRYGFAHQAGNTKVGLTFKKKNAEEIQSEVCRYSKNPEQ